MTRSAALYRLLLRLCERGFREKYGREMELLFVFRCRELQAQRRVG